ncbi:NAD(P)H-binding protein [Streptomyces sp. HD1123-B1]|uniref:SDR family oxidoreductase n=1 Tax=Streptomyces huangiella TaxID=3228804 RepID=UPI003D7E1E50
MTTNLSHVLVLGGTGKTGRRVAAALRHRGLEPAVASRRGPVRFDWADRATWQPALTGIDAVYVVDSQTPGAPAEVRDFTAVAARAGVRRLVLLSARPWGEMGGDHLATEEAVRASGLRWTILRPTWFAQNFTELDFFASLLGQQGELRLPTGDGREPFVDVDDLADAAAEALTDDRHSARSDHRAPPHPRRARGNGHRWCVPGARPLAPRFLRIRHPHRLRCRLTGHEALRLPDPWRTARGDGRCVSGWRAPEPSAPCVTRTHSSAARLTPHRP